MFLLFPQQPLTVDSSSERFRTWWALLHLWWNGTGPRPELVTTACSELGAMRILDILRIFRRVCLLACLFTFESFLFYSPFCCRITHRSSSSPSGMLGLQPEPTSQVQLGFKPFLCASSPLHPLPSNLCGLIISLLAPQSRFPAITGYNSGFYSHLASVSGCPITWVCCH